MVDDDGLDLWKIYSLLCDKMVCLNEVDLFTIYSRTAQTAQRNQTAERQVENISMIDKEDLGFFGDRLIIIVKVTYAEYRRKGSKRGRGKKRQPTKPVNGRSITSEHVEKKKKKNRVRLVAKVEFIIRHREQEKANKL